MNDILWLTMRRVRLPLILLLLVFGISMFGMMLIPGQDAAGNLYYLNFLEAAYFVAFMSTTIGFGEIPYAFTHAQRLFVFSVIYLNVGTWLYAAGTILGLFLDENFRAVLLRTRFARRTKWLGEPFYIVCGIGDTGEQIVNGLDARKIDSTMIEIKSARVQQLQLKPVFGQYPILAADAGEMGILVCAGLDKPNCLGVITTTNDDHTNLKIAISSKLKNSNLKVLARCESKVVADNMKSFSTDHVIDPYDKFSERLELAINSPVKYLVQDWLVAVPGTKLRKQLDPPQGLWVICGLGRFGSKIAMRFKHAGIDFVVVDVREDRLDDYPSSVHGRGTEAHTLKAAGIHEAAGIIAGTGNDVDNLSIIMTARDMNPDIFVIGRQEENSNQALFDSLEADLIARRSHIVARWILAEVTTPLLTPFLVHMLKSKDAWVKRLQHRLEAVLKGYAPNLWLVEISGQDAEGLRICQQFGIKVNLAALTHNTRVESDEQLACVCLVIEGGGRYFMPDDQVELKQGDRLLFAGRSSARREIFWTLSDPNRLLSYSAGVNLPRGAIWRWWYKRRKRKSKKN